MRYVDGPAFMRKVLKQSCLTPPKRKSLVLLRQRGRFIKPCPGTKAYLCCNYHILDFGRGCSLGCHYCILQAYLNFPYMVFYANLQDMFAELDKALSALPARFLRLGTGEFTDSLLLDELTDFTRQIIPYIGKKTNVILELKTKTVNVNNLRDLPHQGKVVVSWSLNTKKIIAQAEPGSASLEERIAAAKQCAQWGYKLGFHFDPLIYYPGWENDYHEVVRLLFAQIDPQYIVWISLGGLRFMPQLKSLIQSRYPGCKLIYEEFVLGQDGKLRYFKPIRIKMYSAMVGWIQNYAPQVLIYLCMESKKVWQEVFGRGPTHNQALSKMLDERCI